MMNSKIFALIVFIILPYFNSSSFAQVPRPDHVIIVIEENHGYDQIIDSPNAPFINKLASSDHTSLFTNAHGVTHPSQPNYVMLFAGSNYGITDDGMPKNLPFEGPNLGAELLDQEYSFAGYSQSLPSVGFTGAHSGHYARKHNPWVNWQNASGNKIPPKLNLPFTSFPKNFSDLPTVSFVIPNQHYDMHNGKDPDRIQRGDQWLKENLAGYAKWAKTHNSLLIITFDEDDFTPANHIATLFVGEMVKKGNYSQKINHFSVLRTLEVMYDLSYTGASAKAEPISDCWVKSGSK